MVVRAVLAGVLLALLGGITGRLIPLFAVGAFGAFTLSQAGMVMHWRRAARGGGGQQAGETSPAIKNPARDPSPATKHPPMAVNLIGAPPTATAPPVLLGANFREGARVVRLLLPA